MADTTSITTGAGPLLTVREVAVLLRLSESCVFIRRDNASETEVRLLPRHDVALSF